MSTDGPTERHKRKSITKSDVTATPKRVYKSHLDRPIHAPRQPVLQWGNVLPQLNGFLHLGTVLAICGALSFIVGNLNRYGLRVDPSCWLDVLRVDDEISYAPLALLLPLPFFAGGTFFIEKRIAAGFLNNVSGRATHVAWLLFMCIYPIVIMVVFGRRIPPVPAILAFFPHTGLMLKLWSYAQTNRWCREKAAMEKKEGCDVGVSQQTEGIVYGPRLEYPANLTAKELAYFIVAPTLCYELNYPRTERRNYAAIAYRLVEIFICTFIFIALIQQWMIPAYKRALLPYAKGNIWAFFEVMLITAVGQNILWLIFFYTNFHCGLVLVAEILCFADKKFYDAWWQAENLDAFWRKWNLPVHNWAVRHLYIPMLRRGFGKRISQYTVFIVSGIFHEYVSSPPLRIIRGHFFFGFFFQATQFPVLSWIQKRFGGSVANAYMWWGWSHQCLIALSDVTIYVEKRYGTRISNSLIWLSLVIGQCTTLLLYVHDHVAEHHGVESLPTLFA